MTFELSRWGKSVHVGRAQLLERVHIPHAEPRYPRDRWV